MLAAAYTGQHGLPGVASEKSSSENEPKPSFSHGVAKQCSKSASSPYKSKSAHMFLATQIMCEIGTTLGQRVAAGQLSEKEMYGTAAEYLSKFPSNLAKLDPVHLLTCPDQVAALLHPETREQLENLIRVSNSAVKDEGHIDECLVKAMGDAADAGKQEQKELMGKLSDCAAEEKGETMNTVKVESVDKAQVSASMIYDEGTDVDTGITERTDMPPNFMFEINEAFSPRRERKQPKKKSSWWNTGTIAVGAGLVGLAGIGIYKYLNN